MSPIIPLLGFLLLMGLAPAQQANPGLPGEVLTPSNFRAMKGATGIEWNIQQGGILQRSGNNNSNNSFIGNLMTMMFGQEQFYNSQVFTTAGGEEFVVPAQQPINGVVDVTRRIRHYPKEGVLRYLDVFTNNSPADATFQVEWKHNFSNEFKKILTDKSRVANGPLDKKESGLIIYPQNQAQSGRPVLFCFSAPRAKLKPIVSTQGQYMAGYAFNLVVPAGKTVSILHTLNQNTSAVGAKGPELQKAFRPLELRRFLKDIPPKLRETIANMDLGNTGGGDTFLMENSLESLGVDRGQQDVLASGEVTRLLGTASCSKLTIGNSLGEITLPFEQVAAMAGPRHAGMGRGKVYLRDGQVLGGLVSAEDLRFVLTSGAVMELSISGLDRLVRSAQPADGQWAATTAALLERQNGDRIALGPADATPLTAATRWGPLETKLGDLSMIHPIDLEANGLWITLKDGSKFTAFLTGAPLRLPTVLFGEKDIAPQEVRVFQSQREAMAEKTEAKKASVGKSAPPSASGGPGESGVETGQPWLQLAGGQRIIGRVNLPALALATDNERIELTPDSIRSLKNAATDEEPEPGSAPLFEVKLWGGSVMQARLDHGVLPVMVGGSPWHIPVIDIEGYENPVPRIPESMQTKIAALIRSLGHEDWQTRDKASKELAEIGYMAKTLLTEANRVNPDPEVRRRIEQLLTTME